MAESGTAPTIGCSKFGVDIDNAIERLVHTYVREGFAGGRSAQKFIVGPYGSGKTHFLRHLMEESDNCVTAEVTLDRNLDFTNPLDVYKQVSTEIRSPSSNRRGISPLFQAIASGILSKAADVDNRALFSGWIQNLGNLDFESHAFRRVAQQAFQGLNSGNESQFERCVQWLEGDVTDRTLARQLSVEHVGRSAEARTGQRLLFSLLQLIRTSGFAGTVICFDEAEQSFSVDRKKKAKLESAVLSLFNATSDLESGSALLVFALTPDVFQGLLEFSALSSRLTTSGQGRSFHQGNTLAATIELTEGRPNPEQDLMTIGQALIAYANSIDWFETAQSASDTQQKVESLAQTIAKSDGSISARRKMIRATCALLLSVCDDPTLPFTPELQDDPEPDDEV